MALRLVCDGCGADLDEAAAVRRGRLVQTFYCAECATTLDAAFAEIDAKRVQLVRDFEAFRAARLARLRETVQALPDA
jgi:hypothetical protein